MTFKKNTVDSYSMKFGKDDEGWRCQWAIVNVDSGTGSLTATTDCGDYAYRWGYNDHEEFKHLLIRIGCDDYLLNKISSRSVVNEEKSVKEIKRRILEYRRSGDIEKDDARELWDSIGSIENDYRDYDFQNAVYREMGEDYYDLVIKEYPTGARTFVEVVFKHLIEILKSEEKSAIPADTEKADK